jgi:adenosylhomocysteine nucleosidase
MKDAPIGLVMALQEEAQPILCRFGGLRRERLKDFPLYRFRAAGREVCLVRSGMGMAKAAAATAALIEAVRPSMIISAGVGGAVLPGLAVGDVIVAGGLFTLAGGSLSRLTSLDSAPLLAKLNASLRAPGFAIAAGAIITTGGILHKQEAAKIIPCDLANPVLDMETASVAETAARSRTPLIALRAVSDPADEEFHFSLDEITDRNLDIRIGKVLLAILRKPLILPQMLRLARNTKAAAENLAFVIERTIELN